MELWGGLSEPRLTAVPAQFITDFCSAEQERFRRLKADLAELEGSLEWVGICMREMEGSLTSA